jgi:integrase
VASIKKRPDGVYRARYRDDADREHARHFARRADAQRWLDEQTAKLIGGTHVEPRQACTTVAEWCDTWLAGYQGHRTSTVTQAQVHLVRIRAEFGEQRLASIRPSQVRTWCAKLAAEGLAPSYFYALHGRLAQIYSDAVHDGLVAKSPCSRRTSPPAGKHRAYVATTEQIWALHDAMPEHLRAAVLLGAFAGLRLSEACGLRTGDVDFMRGVISPVVQFPDDPLKTETSMTPIPIGQSLALGLSAHVARWSSRSTILANELRRPLSPRTLQRACGLPARRFPTFRPGSGSRTCATTSPRYSSPAGRTSRWCRRGCGTRAPRPPWTPTPTYGPDSDDSTRAAIDAVLLARSERVSAGRARAAQDGPPS